MIRSATSPAQPVLCEARARRRYRRGATSPAKCLALGLNTTWVDGGCSAWDRRLGGRCLQFGCIGREEIPRANLLVDSVVPIGHEGIVGRVQRGELRAVERNGRAEGAT